MSAETIMVRLFGSTEQFSQAMAELAERTRRVGATTHRSMIVATGGRCVVATGSDGVTRVHKLP